MSLPGWRKKGEKGTRKDTESGRGGGAHHQRKKETEMTAMVDMDAQWRTIFDRFDTDRDGIVRLSEFRQMLANTNLGHELRPDVRNRLISRADRDRDGVLDYREFLDLINSPEITPMQRQRFFYGMMRKYATKVVLPRVKIRDIVDGRFKQDITDGKYDDQYTCFPPPMFIFTASAVEVAVFIYYCVMMGEFSTSAPVPFQSPLIYNPRRRYEAWRFLTYMLIHAGFVHITVNIIVQLFIGIPLEMVHKWWRVGIIYAAGVVAGSLGTSISDPSVYLAGASGGVYALITAHLATIILNYREMELAWLQLLFFFIITGTDICAAIYNRYSKPAGSDKVGYAAHFWGAVAGLLVGIGVLRNLEEKSWETKLWWICIVVYFLLMLVAIVWNAGFPSYFETRDMS